jgi:hypothetical protein
MQQSYSKNRAVQCRTDNQRIFFRIIMSFRFLIKTKEKMRGYGGKSFLGE